MRNKNTVIFLLVVFSVICGMNLFYTYRSFNMESTLKNATDQERQDLMEDESFMKSYRNAQKGAFSLGLDLQGGLFVTMEVGVQDILLKKAGTSVDDIFRTAIDKALEEKKTSQQSLVDIFAVKLREEYVAQKKIDEPNLLYRYFSGEKDINYNTPDGEIINYLKAETEQAIQNTFTIIRTRIDQFGVTSPNLQLQAGTGRILLELPGVKNPERVKKLLRGTAKLEFRETVGFNEAFPVLDRINKYVSREEGVAVETADTTAKDSSKVDSTKTGDNAVADGGDEENAEEEEDVVAGVDELLNNTPDALAEGDSADGDSADVANLSDEEQREKFEKENPFFSKFAWNERQDPDYPLMGYVRLSDTAYVNRWMRDPKVQDLIPITMKFLWEAKPQSEDSEFLGLIAIRKGSDDKAPLEGNVITDAKQDFEQGLEPIVNMEMNTKGAEEWARLTKANLKRCVAIVLDDLVYSFPRVNQTITGGRSQISGNFTVDEAKDLANLLKAGTLPVEARILGDVEVGPTLGASNLQKGLMSFLIAFLATIVFMVFYYSKSGLVANVALLCNIFFILGVSAALNVVFTLPGIAAVVLTMGMAVDANVLIFDRIREEQAMGKSLKASIKAGFNNAFSSVMDANITTFLTGVVLFVFGVGPIKGFAVSLMIGIITSLISALFITRLFLEYFANKGPDAIKFGTKTTVNAFTKVDIGMTRKKKTFYGVSAVLVVLSIVSFFTLGFKTGVDFKGGRQYTIAFNQEVAPEQIRSELTDAFENEAPVIKTVGGENNLLITTPYKVDDDNADQLVRDLMMSTIEKSAPGSEPKIVESSRVGPTVANDIRRSAYFSIIFSLLMIFAYIFIRFRGARYSLGAIAALFHDVIIVLGIFSLVGSLDLLPFALEIDQAIIAALLTIIGYSINDTVVVFDRIRENFGEMKTAPMKEVYDTSINQTISRTLITSVTTMITVLILFFLGGDTIKGFMFALLVGILVGTYSSIFVASPISLDLAAFFAKNKRKK